jgi:hypothetical protein
VAVGPDRDAELRLERLEVFVVRAEERLDPLFRDRDAARGRSGDVGVSSEDYDTAVTNAESRRPNAESVTRSP